MSFEDIKNTRTTAQSRLLRKKRLSLVENSKKLKLFLCIPKFRPGLLVYSSCHVNVGSKELFSDVIIISVICEYVCLRVVK
jgi:hypothetical protein